MFADLIMALMRFGGAFLMVFGGLMGAFSVWYGLSAPHRHGDGAMIAASSVFAGAVGIILFSMSF